MFPYYFHEACEPVIVTQLQDKEQLSRKELDYGDWIYRPVVPSFASWSPSQFSKGAGEKPGIGVGWEINYALLHFTGVLHKD